MLSFLIYRLFIYEVNLLVSFPNPQSDGLRSTFYLSPAFGPDCLGDSTWRLRDR